MNHMNLPKILPIQIGPEGLGALFCKMPQATMNLLIQTDLYTYRTNPSVWRHSLTKTFKGYALTIMSNLVVISWSSPSPVVADVILLLLVFWYNLINSLHSNGSSWLWQLLLLHFVGRVEKLQVKLQNSL